MSIRRFVRITLLFAVAVLLLPAGVAWATSCSGDCEGTDCNGGCNINSINCSTACTDDGCPGKAICKEYGGASYECYHEFTSSCTREEQNDPPDGPEQQAKTFGLEVRDTEWSVISYEADELSSMAWAGVDVMATSNRFHADRTVDELIARQREESGRLRQRLRQEGLRIDRGRALQGRLLYSVSPAGRCVRARMEMEERRFGVEIPEHAAVFARTTVDSKGTIAAIELLHADRTAGTERAMLDFLKLHARLTRTDGEAAPYEAYVVLYSGPGNTANWIVSGSSLLQ